MIKKEAMTENTNTIESLIERTTEYGKSSLELIKLKTLDKTSDVISSLVPNLIVTVFILSFMLFASVGLALWLGQIIGQTGYGFFIVGFSYGIVGIFVHLFMQKWLKRIIGDNIIKQVLK